MSDNQSIQVEDITALLGTAKYREVFDASREISSDWQALMIQRLSFEFLDLWERAALIVGFWEQNQEAPSNLAILYCLHGAAAWRWSHVFKSVPYMRSSGYIKTVEKAERAAAKLEKFIGELTDTHHFIGAAPLEKVDAKKFYLDAEFPDPFSDLDDQLRSLAKLKEWLVSVKARANPALDRTQKLPGDPNLSWVAFWMKAAWNEMLPDRPASAEEPSEPTRSARRLNDLGPEARRIVSGKSDIEERDPDFVLFSKAIIALQGDPDELTATPMERALREIAP